MAKYKATTGRHETGMVITTKTAFGSHSEMIDEEKSSQAPDGMVVCKDDKGFYTTYKNRIDTGLADPCRYSSKRE